MYYFSININRIFLSGRTTRTPPPPARVLSLPCLPYVCKPTGICLPYRIPFAATLALLRSMQGQRFVSPVSADLPHPCVGLSSAVRGLIRLHDAEEEGEWGTRDRSVQ